MTCEHAVGAGIDGFGAWRWRASRIGLSSNQLPDTRGPGNPEAKEGLPALDPPFCEGDGE